MASDENMDKAYKAALQNMEKLVAKQEALKKSIEGLKDSWNVISSEIFKIDGAQFFKQIPKSAQELKEMAGTVTEFEKNFRKAGEQFANMINQEGLNSKINELGQTIKTELGDAFKTTSFESSVLLSDYLSQLKSIAPHLASQIKDEKHLKELLEGRVENQDDLLKNLKEQKVFQDAELKFANDYDKKQQVYKDRLSSIKQQFSELNAISDEQLVNLAQQIAMTDELAGGAMDWQKIIKNSTPEQRTVLSLLHGDAQAMLDINDAMSEAADTVAKIKEDMLKPNDIFSLGKSIEALGGRMRRDMIDTILNFDEVINKIQKDTGINMDGNSQGFRKLTTDVAQYGVSVEDAGEMMSDLSKELNTTNFSVLSQATKDFAAFEGATGAAKSDINTIAGELMRMGESSAQVKDFMQGADQQSRLFGVSSSKVLASISRNMSKMRKFGFTGGEESLRKMAVQAEKLHISVDSIFDMAEHARNIEGAIEMAAELQLAGGSFANINPMDLLSAARKGPAELQKILASMGKDIGAFNADGEYKFDPIDADRLRIAAEAAHVPVEDFEKMIAQNATNQAKLNPFQGTLDGLNEADKEIAQSTLGDMLKRGADGTISVDMESDMVKKMGIKDLKDLQSRNVQDLIVNQKENAKTIEEQNKRNQSLKQSFDNFINALLSVFGIFEPIITMLTTVMQSITAVFSELPAWSQVLVSGLLVAFGLFGTSVGAFITKGLGGFMKIGKNLLGGGKDPIGAALGEGGVTAPGMDAKGGAEKKGFLTGLSQGIQEFGKVKWADLLKFAASLTLIGGAIIGFTYALQAAGGEASFAQWANAVGALVILGGSILLMSKLFGQVDMGNVAKGALAMLLIGASILPFSYAAQMMSDVDWGSVLIGVGIMALVVIGLFALGAMLAGPQIIFLALGVATLIAVGASLLIAAGGLLLAASAFNALATVDWTSFSMMGSALMSVVPGMLGFSIAAMAFANPISLFGLFMMATTLGGLGMVMSPLAISLDMGAKALDSFASGLDKLSAAADRLSLDKLEQLKELSSVLANSSVKSINSSNNSSNSDSGKNKSSSSDGEIRKIEINLKLNGKDLQRLIINDTKLLT